MDEIVLRPFPLQILLQNALLRCSSTLELCSLIEPCQYHVLPLCFKAVRPS
ncbi:unnamed protein product, partial [Musa acuminata var. zebrina]